jgi:hypothetical protein
MGVILAQLHGIKRWSSRAVSLTPVLPFFVQSASLCSVLLATVFSNTAMAQHPPSAPR